MSDSPNFFLTTAGENSDLADPRACWTKGRLRDRNRDDYMLVEIDPPLIGQGFGLGGNDITLLLLSTKLEGRTLFPITVWPEYVYVTRIVDPVVLKTLTISADQVELVAWGFLYPSFDEAAAAASKFK
jgi:hypothetical protein